MNYDELLAKIDGTGFQYGEDYVWKIDGAELKKGTNALRLVVELHKPIQDKKLWCEGCRVEDDDWYSIEYPCPTIQAIEKELE